MALIYSTAIKTSRMTAVKDAIDGGSSNGRLEIMTSSSGTILATVNLDDPCGTVGTVVLTFSGFPKTVTASATGTATYARIVTSDGTICVYNLSVGTTGTDIILASTTIIQNNNLTINSASITHAA